MTEDTVLSGCEVICIGEQDTDLVGCPLPLDEQRVCIQRRQYLAGWIQGWEASEHA